MRRQIRWTELDADGNKRDIRVTIHGRGIKWQFKGRHDAEWDYDTAPSEAQWDNLEVHLAKRYQRGRVALDKELDLVRKARAR